MSTSKWMTRLPGGTVSPPASRTQGTLFGVAGTAEEGLFSHVFPSSHESTYDYTRLEEAHQAAATKLVRLIEGVVPCAPLAIPVHHSGPLEYLGR